MNGLTGQYSDFTTGKSPQRLRRSQKEYMIKGAIIERTKGFKTLTTTNKLHKKSYLLQNLKDVQDQPDLSLKVPHYLKFTVPVFSKSNI